MDKPYDSTAMIDKVRKLLAAPAGAKPVAAAAPAAAAAPVAAAAAKPAAAPAPVAAAAAAPQRAKTMLYNPGGVNMPAIPGGPAAAPAAAPAKTDVAAAKPAGGVAGAVASPMNGQMTAKLEELGLTQAQIEGVLALSREVVERVVWEVVPVLAETLIKEEIARLTK
jgi:hypothetical protein